MTDTENAELVAFHDTEDLEGFGFHQKLCQDPLGIFLKYPIRQVREKCLEYLSGVVFPSRYAPEFIESVINSFIHKLESRMAWRLMEYYVVNSNDEMAPSAMEFAIQLALKGTSVNPVAKMIIARLTGKSPAAYWRVPSMESFLNFLLEIVGRETRLRGYMESDWVQVQRAVNLLLKFDDTSHLPVMKNLLGKMKSGEVRPWEDSSEFMHADNLHFMKTRVGRLEKIEARENPGLSHEVGTFIRKAASIKGNVSIQLLHQEIATEGNVAPVVVSFETSRPEERKKFNEWLLGEHLRVSFEAEGFITASDFGEFYVHQNQTNWMVELKPTLGKNRVSVSFGDKSNKTLARSVAYIRCVKPSDAPAA